MKKQKLILRIKIFAVILALTTSFTFASFDDGDDFELIKNLEIYHLVFKELRLNYVDKIDAAELITLSIDKMLKSLDPYTVYYPESKIEDYRYFSKGEYAGLGIRVDTMNNYFVITHLIKDAPAHHSGLLVGDKILKVEDIDTKDKTLDDLSNLLKGEADVAVNLLIKRNNKDKAFVIKVIRKKIKLKNIPHYGVLENNIGYIKLDRFTAEASSEVRAAFIELKDEHNITSLVLDLRGNPGGLLTQAVNIVNLFVEKDILIVEMKGKATRMNKTFKTKQIPVDTEIPLIVLVDGRSASASEIVSGALQDLDRAVIVGEQTYGKGLVQSTLTLKYNARLKVTTAKYYIPSGRCVQSIDYANDRTDSKNIPDSLLVEFKTKNGRSVYEGKGVKPDVVLKKEEKQPIIKALKNQNIIFDFATNFRLEQDSINYTPDNYIANNFEDFLDYLEEINFDRKTEAETKYDNLLQAVEDGNYSEETIQDVISLEAKIQNNDIREAKDSEKEITTLIGEEIITRYYFAEGKLIYSQKYDKNILETIKIFSNIDDYNNLLK